MEEGLTAPTPPPHPTHLFVHQWDEKSRGSRGRHGAGTLLPFLFVCAGKTDRPAAREQHKVVRRISSRKCCIEENKQDLPSVQIIQRRLQNPQASLSDGERDVRAGRQLKESAFSWLRFFALSRSNLATSQYSQYAHGALSLPERL